MSSTVVGIVHPGAMGSSVAASAKNSGCDVYWASEGRSAQTHQRATDVGLHDVETLTKLCKSCSVLVSVIPPHAAEQVAEHVAGRGFTGVYVDANAISPQRVVHIGQSLEAAGVDFVDGGIVGGPAWKPGKTWLYLSGPRAEEIAALFAAGPLETTVIGDRPGRASALKMCYAAYTKGTTALLSAILATADRLEVWQPLQVQWARNWPGFDQETVQRVRGVTAKAWRFSGEMEEIASTLEAVGLPGGFHSAAATIYRRLAHFKGAPSLPGLEEVLAALSQADDTAPPL